MSKGFADSTLQVQPVELREAQRYKLNWLIRIGEDEVTVETGQLRDISRIGAFACFKNSPELHSIVSLSIRLPFEPETWMKYSAVVVRIENMKNAKGVAFRFKSSRPLFETVHD